MDTGGHHACQRLAGPLGSSQTGVLGMSPLPQRRETVLFVVVTLALAYLLGAAFILTGGRHRLIVHALMCVPGAVALTLMWLVRHEPPRAAGFAYTGWGSWGIAAVYPLAVIAAALTLAYVVRLAGRRPEFISFRPENVNTVLLGHRFQGLPAAGALGLGLVATFFIWLLIALAYRRGFGTA